MTTAVYLDHNVLDAYLKGRVSNLTELISSKKGVAVYSKENLNEIRKSKGYENQFLTVLTQFKALFLDIEATSDGRLTGEHHLVESDPFVEFKKFEEALADAPASNFGLDRLLQKFYGGDNDTSFTDIVDQGLGDLVEMLDKTLAECRGEMPHEMLAGLEAKISALKEQAVNHSAELGHMLANYKEKSSTTAFEIAVGVGPKQLNNILSPHVLQQIWGMLSPSVSKNISFEQFFGLASAANNIQTPQSLIEKANAIYHALNFTGFYRDEGMKKLRRVHASGSDMTHAGYATACAWLITGDLNLAKKAEAIYEYLEINTKVHHVGT